MNRNTIRRLILFSLTLVLALSGCSAARLSGPDASFAPTQDAAATPSPAPTPEPVVAVFGAEDAPLFREGMLAAAKDGSYAVYFISGGVDALSSYRPPVAAAAVIYLAGAANTLPETDFPLYVYAANGQTVPDTIPHLTYLGAGTEQLALDSAIAYPPHLTPVRMIGLFETASGAASARWSAASQDGAVFAKRTYIAESSETSLSDWLADAFSAYSPGTLDAVFAETGTLALAAADMLASLGRDDLEVFSAGTDAGADRALSNILVCAVGANEKAAGALCYGEAAKLLFGGAAESGTLAPEALWYSPNP